MDIKKITFELALMGYELASGMEYDYHFYTKPDSKYWARISPIDYDNCLALIPDHLLDDNGCFKFFARASTVHDAIQKVCKQWCNRDR